MATAGAAILAGYCGFQVLVLPGIALAIVGALWLGVAGALRHRAEFALGWRPWLEVGFAGEHSGIHTVPLGIAVITSGLAGWVAQGSTWSLPSALVAAGLLLTWLLTLFCVVRFLWSLAQYGVALEAMDGAWFLVPAALLGAAIATMDLAALGAGGWAGWLRWTALLAAALGWFGYWAVAGVAIVRLRRFGRHGVPQAPWWIAMGCAGLAAAALGCVSDAGEPWPSLLREVLVAAMCVTQIFTAALCVPVVVASVEFLLRRCRFRDPAAWPPTFSTAVFALGGLWTGRVLHSTVFWRIGLGAGFATLAFWLVTVVWNVGNRVRRHHSGWG
jgi:hypothetical protein